MEKRESPAHAREIPPQLNSEDVIASARWRERVGTGPVAEAPLEQVSDQSVRARVARAVKAPVLAGIAVFMLAVIVTIGIVASSSISGNVPETVLEQPPSQQVDALATEVNDSDAAEAVAGAATDTVMYVHVVGEVTDPGIVELEAGDRVQDAIREAGGATAQAELTAVNLARVVLDGEQIVVPDAALAEEWAAVGVGASGVLPPEPAGGEAGAGTPGEAMVPLINLNTADAAQLETLPRVGPALAERIIDWRTQNEGFSSVEQLLDISGIGAKTLAGFRDLVTV